jgi:hypothetical protein
VEPATVALAAPAARADRPEQVFLAMRLAAMAATQPPRPLRPVAVTLPRTQPAASADRQPVDPSILEAAALVGPAELVVTRTLDPRMRAAELELAEMAAAALASAGMAEVPRVRPTAAPPPVARPLRVPEPAALRLAAMAAQAARPRAGVPQPVRLKPR